MFLAQRCDQEIEMVWQGDPAVVSDGKEVIHLAEAKLGKGKKPDRFVVRALNNREVFSVSAYGQESQIGLALAAVEICTMATIRIHQADGQIIKDTDKIRTLIDESAPPDFVGALASAIYGLTVGADSDGGAGADPLPLRSGAIQT